MKYRLNRPPLDEWKNREGRTFAWLAQRVGLRSENFYQQLYGSHSPTLATVMALSEVTEIPVPSLVRKVSSSEVKRAGAR